MKNLYFIFNDCLQISVESQDSICGTFPITRPLPSSNTEIFIELFDHIFCNLSQCYLLHKATNRCENHGQRKKRHILLQKAKRTLRFNGSKYRFDSRAALYKYADIFIPTQFYL